MCPSQTSRGFWTLDELLEDPLTQLVMQADGLAPEQVRNLFGEVMSHFSEDRLSPEGQLAMHLREHAA